MTKKNFSQMTSKKLNALLATASEADKALIEQELAARQTAAAQQEELDNEPVGGYDNPEVTESELTDEEKAAVEAAKANGGKVPAKPKMTEEERNALIDELKANVVGHRCNVLPAGKAEWVGGYVAGIMNDKRATNILLVIKTDDGRTIRKMHNAETLRVLDEKVEGVKASTGARRGRVAKADKDTPWDTLEDETIAAAEHVGKECTFQEFKGDETKGRIISIVPDKRVKKLLYRIVIEEGELKKYVHKAVTAELKLEDLDEAGQKIHDDFLARREAITSKEPLTLAQKIAKAELYLQKAEERVAIANAKLETAKDILAKLKAEAENTVDAAQAAAEAELAEEPEAPATEPENDELS